MNVPLKHCHNFRPVEVIFSDFYGVKVARVPSIGHLLDLIGSGINGTMGHAKKKKTGLYGEFDKLWLVNLPLLTYPLRNKGLIRP